jgi:uncharacterized protein YndB with AHSA1/START domain
MKSCLLALFLLAASHPALAEPVAEYPKVDDTSYTEANGDRVIRQTVEIGASTDEIWRLITTSAGWKRFAAPVAFVDMQLGGVIETSYDAKAQQGDTNNIKNQIVAYVPGRMLSIRCIQAPSRFEHKDEFFKTATIMEIERLAEKKSRVTLTAVGYRPGEAYDALYKMFRWGDAYTLDKMRLAFEPAPATNATPSPDANNPKQK